MKEVYINKIEKFLPNDPVSNEEMEERLGLVNGNESINRGLILRSNQIKTRYYALDKTEIPHTPTPSWQPLPLKNFLTTVFHLTM
jgi:3-oxoacyl-[acyl-carrier-protein] synthase-3